jgi:hypothetical protein
VLTVGRPRLVGVVCAVAIASAVPTGATLAAAPPAHAWGCGLYGCWGPGYYGAGWYNGAWWGGGWYDPPRSDGSPYSCPIAWNLCGPPPQYQKCGPC